MKKLFFAVVFTAIAMTGANAQTFGAKAGLNMSNFRFSGANATANKEGQKSAIGFAIGGFAAFEISDKLTFQPELLFSMQGAKHSESGTTLRGSSYNYEDTFKMSYINIPLIAKYYVTDAINIQFGPQIGFLMSAKDDYTRTNGGSTESGSTDIKDEYRSIDFGVDFGAGYKLDNLSFDLRYNLGLGDIIEIRPSSDNNKAFNNVIQFTVGYAFN